MILEEALRELKVTSNDIVIIRDLKKGESRCPYCGPYKQFINNQKDKLVEDYWRDSDFSVIIVLDNKKDG